jgi:hypothetical protein
MPKEVPENVNREVDGHIHVNKDQKLEVEFRIDDLVKKLMLGSVNETSCGGCHGCTGCSM